MPFQVSRDFDCICCMRIAEHFYLSKENRLEFGISATSDRRCFEHKVIKKYRHSVWYEVSKDEYLAALVLES